MTFLNAISKPYQSHIKAILVPTIVIWDQHGFNMASTWVWNDINL